MNAACHEQLRDRFYRSMVYLGYLEQVYAYADKSGTDRLTELKQIKDSNTDLTYAQFVEKYGKEFLNEFYHRELLFKYLLLHSIFIQFYALFENTMVTWAEILEEYDSTKKRSEFARSEYKSDIDRARLLINRFYKIEAASINESWKTLNKFRLVRNAIVHNDCRIKKDIQSTKDLLNSYNTIIHKGTNEFMIRNDTFLTDFLALMKGYLKNVIDEMSPVMNRNVPHLLPKKKK